jgi:ABC-type dipeptide/oligopeptide/nickel transport system permease component
MLAIVLATLIAVPLGLFTGTRAGSTSDTLGTVFAVLTVSVPTFWLGLMLILFLGDYLRWLPVSGSGGPANLIMPVITLAAFSAGFVTRVTRASVIEELHHNYVVTARSKGLGSWRVNYRHVLRNVLIPTVTIVALQLGHLLGGSVIVETVFAWPGAGWLLMQGVFARDLPVVRGMVLIIGATFILLNLMVDIAYRYIDPRIRY